MLAPKILTDDNLAKLATEWKREPNIQNLAILLCKQGIVSSEDGMPEESVILMGVGYRTLQGRGHEERLMGSFSAYGKGTILFELNDPYDLEGEDRLVISGYLTKHPDHDQRYQVVPFTPNFSGSKLSIGPTSDKWGFNDHQKEFVKQFPLYANWSTGIRAEPWDYCFIEQERWKFMHSWFDKWL